jgi:dCMP deaminase
MALTHKHFLDICEILASASHATRSKVGCIIVKDGNIISQSYNGTPRGFDNACEDKEGVTLPEVLHAESNAIAKMARSTQSCNGATLYTLLSPCLQCAKLMIQSGIREVYFRELYRDDSGIQLLNKGCIYVFKV